MNTKTIFAGRQKNIEHQESDRQKDVGKSADSEKNNSLTTAVQQLVKKYQDSLNLQIKGEVTVIHVDEIASKLASFYEKVTRVVDWKEEHLLRRTAIERMLKRRLISEISGLQLVSNLKAKRWLNRWF